MMTLYTNFQQGAVNKQLSTRSCQQAAVNKELSTSRRLSPHSRKSRNSSNKLYIDSKSPCGNLHRKSQHVCYVCGLKVTYNVILYPREEFNGLFLNRLITSEHENFYERESRFGPNQQYSLSLVVAGPGSVLTNSTHCLWLLQAQVRPQPTNMATGISAVVDGYKKFMETKSDPRTADWFLMSSPMPLLIILISYLYFVNKAGPRYMKDRKPHDLRHVMLAYNALQIVFSVYLVYEGLMSGWLKDYSYKCQPIDYSDNPIALRVRVLVLTLQVFFVLRKKNNQISYLHLYHHTLMPVCSWVGVRFLPGTVWYFLVYGGHGTLLGLINSFVHIIMYSYYLFAGLGPRFQKYLWWKKHLTTMQMVQFVIVFLHSSQLLLFECNYPKGIVALLGVNALYFLYLFGTFYRRTYFQRSCKKDD
uniref:Elongation of very long chain fatty acids protein n=2 Tax=Timema TaxID=61471 RepID=A0A7R9B728_TIMSH|nr:unnamed protein product [Timema shepardi]